MYNTGVKEKIIIQSKKGKNKYSRSGVFREGWMKKRRREMYDLYGNI